MDLPDSLKAAIERQTQEFKHAQLMQDTQTLSLRYRTETGRGKPLLTQLHEAAAYSVYRMPATYGAVFTALKYSMSLTDSILVSLMDVGAGTGAASWAAASLLDLKSIVCLEREEAMGHTGKKLMSEAPLPLSNAKWIRKDLVTDHYSEKADLVIASYVFNELTDEERMLAISKLWEAADKILLIVEPGTPDGYTQLMKMRSLLLEQGSHIVAPCPHEQECKLKQGDWCHFACRVPRSRLHRRLKDGDVPYEDEKFSYLCLSRKGEKRADARILRHPHIEKGQITLDICSPEGIRQKKVRKREGVLYKQARKVKWGDGMQKLL